MTSDWIYYFGYGSLVNRDTRPEGEFAAAAHLSGWRRVWEHRTADPERTQQCTSLSIEPLDTGSGAGIDGMVARMAAADLDQLDERESGYERLALPAHNFKLPDIIETDTIYVYRSLPHNRYLAEQDHPILQSYIDCVLAGYHEQFGQDGMLAMLASTDGWQRPIMNDRAAPHYPRWVDVDCDMQSYFDQQVALLAAKSR